MARGERLLAALVVKELEVVVYIHTYLYTYIERDITPASSSQVLERQTVFRWLVGSACWLRWL